MVKFTCQAIQSRTFVGWDILITFPILFVVIGPFRFSDSYWFSLKDCIYLRIYLLFSVVQFVVTEFFLIFSYNHCISMKLVVTSVSFLILFLSSPLFFDESGLGLSMLFIFSKNLLLVSFKFCIFLIYLIYVCSDFYYFLSSSHFGLALLFFL